MPLKCVCVLKIINMIKVISVRLNTDMVTIGAAIKDLLNLELIDWYASSFLISPKSGTTKPPNKIQSFGLIVKCHPFSFL
mgnify:CR=1 FL=1